MKITSEILIALNTAIKKAGSQAEFARMANISPVYIGRYLNGTNKKMTLENKIKVWPLIKSFLPEDYLPEEKAHITRDWSRADPSISFDADSVASDAELEILKRDAKIAQYVLQIAYLERKVKRLQELNFNQEADPSASE